jgi:hypothetical protein
MVIIWGLAAGMMFIAHYVLWISTKTWMEFLIYLGIMHAFGILFGVLPGLKLRKELKEAQAERDRLARLRQLKG